MTAGSPMRLILVFAIPFFISNVLQQLYSVADTAVAGHILGDAALAEIGATAAMTSLIIDFIHGLTMGFGLIVSRAFGAQDEKVFRRASAWMILLSMLWAFVLTGLTLSLTPQLMGWLKTPEEIAFGAQLYLRTILIGLPLTMLYNVLSNLLRAVGNSVMPLLFLVFSCFVNVALDLLFLGVFRLGVQGAALATVFAQGVSAVCCLAYIVRCHPELRLSRADFLPKLGFIAEMTATGLSMALMNTIYAIGSVVLQGAINALGAATIAGHIAGRRIIEIFFKMRAAFSTANSTFVSQNHGAGERERIKKGLFSTFICVFAIDALALVFAFTLARPVLAFVTGSTDPDVLSCGLMNIQIALPCLPFCSILVVLRLALQGVGHRLAPLLCSVVELITKLLFGLALVPRFGYIAAALCEPVAWALCAIFVLEITWRYREDLGFRPKQQNAQA